MNVLSHKGYFARVDFDADDELFVGRIAGINDVVGFHSDSAGGLKTAFREAIEDYLETCRAEGRAPDKPYSGKVMFRVPPELHARAALAAQITGKSLNQWAEEALRAAAQRDVPA